MAGDDPTVDVLLLRLEAPLMSFGGVAVDELRPTLELPGRALLTGLLANALGWHHADGERLDRLQRRLVYAVRRDRPGQRLEDFQTVDLSQDFLHAGWTTRDRPEGRGGASGKGTHIRDRHYLVDAAYTVALSLDPATEEPDLDALEAALRRPARPLFLGRKACLPSRPLVGRSGETDRRRAASPLAALARVPLWAGREDGAPLRVWWPGAPGGAPPAGVDVPGVRFDRSLPLYDDRDWRHQFHAGRRFVHEGDLRLESKEASDG